MLPLCNQVENNVVLMSGHPPVITSTWRVVCTQYCPHLLSPGILIPANTNHHKRVKYNKEKEKKLNLVFPTLSSQDHFRWVGLRVPSSQRFLNPNSTFDWKTLFDYYLLPLIRHHIQQLN